MDNKKLKIFSFFSKSGFLDLGFEKAGYEIEIVNEFQSMFMKAYQYSRSKMDIPKPEHGYFNIDVNDFWATEGKNYKGILIHQKLMGV